MPKLNSNSTGIRIHPQTRDKLNRIKQAKPAWNVGAIVDEAIDLLLEREQLVEPRPGEREQSAA